jgi:D-sedoheptulose 7-phosphate isomerase
MNIKSPIEYANALSKILLEADWEQVTELITALREVRDSGGRLYVCGNGGSAASAMRSTSSGA